MKQLFHLFVTRSIEFIFRPRNIGWKVMAGGISLLALSAGLNHLLKLRWAGHQGQFDLEFSTGEGLPQGFLQTLFGIGVVLVLVGLALTVAEVMRAWRREASPDIS